MTQTIQQMKSGKAPETDICTEMFTTDRHFSDRVFTDLFRDIWTNVVINNYWNKCLIVKLPNNGDLQQCDNYRAISLLLLSNKKCCRVLLNRIDGTIDAKLRLEQVGFRRVKDAQIIYFPPQHH